MNNIEVGEYYRTKKGYIHKIIKIYKDNKPNSDKYIKIKVEDNNYAFFLDITSVVNHSKNIIDLIEVGDYVNGFKVDVDFLINELVINVYYEDDDKEWQNIKDIEIKSIVTKQQFKAIEYKIEG